MTFEASGAEAVAGITRRAAERLRAGHLWVYRSDVERLTAGAGEQVAGGALVSVVDGRGIPLGTALYSDASEIALRMVSRQEGVGRAEYLDEVGSWAAGCNPAAGASGAERRSPGVARQTLAGWPSPRRTSCRGSYADRYGELVVVQLLTQGTAQDDVRAVLAEVLAEQDWVRTVVERPDARVRELEHLEPAPEGPLYVRAGCEATLQTVFAINGVRFHFDAGAGQKTGRVSGPETELCGRGAMGWRARRAALSMCVPIRAGLRCTWRGCASA